MKGYALAALEEYGKGWSRIVANFWIALFAAGLAWSG